jgi:hypothetical protein
MRDGSASHTFRFGTGILAVNKEIHREAREVLVKNHFVVVSYRWLNFGRWKHALDLPTVTENQSDVAKFQAHVLRVHVKGPNECSKGQQVESFLMVAVDLPILRSLLVWHCYCCPPPAKFMAEQVAQPYFLEVTPGVKNGITTLLELRTTGITEFPTKLASWILDQFAGFSHGNQKVKIQAFPQELANKVARTISTMSPKVVWLTALVWSVLEFSEDLSNTAERFALGDQFGQLAFKHTALNYMLREFLCWFSAMPVPPELYDVRDFQLPVTALQCLYLSSMLTESFIGIRTHPYEKSYKMQLEVMESFVHNISGAPEPLKSDTLKHIIDGDLHHMLMWFSVLVDFFTIRKPANLQEYIHRMDVLAGYVGRVPHFQHDLQFMKRVAHDPRVLIPRLSLVKIFANNFPSFALLIFTILNSTSNTDSFKAQSP